MSNKGNDEKKSAPAPPPPFSGFVMPANPNLTMPQDIGEEVVRRVAGGFNPGGGSMSFDSRVRSAPFSGGFAMGDPTLQSTSMGKAQVQASVAPAPQTGPFVWKLNDAPTLPDFYLLERSAVFVPKTDALEVSKRISKAVWDYSIEATFDDEKAKAKCTTPEGVDFRIRLYRGRKQYSHGIIVEVQRRFGTSLTFHNEAKAILDAAEGKKPAPPQTVATPLPLVSDSEDDYEPPSASSSLSMVSKMLSVPGYDSHYLALQTLSSLTDPKKMGRSTAKNVSRELVDPDNEVGRKVAALIIDSTRDKEETFGLRALAMAVTANALQSVGGSIPGVLREGLRPVLLNELEKSEANPRMAQLAAKCLEPLIEGDHEPSGLYDALEKAKEVGSSRHAGLMKQAERCLRKIR